MRWLAQLQMRIQMLLGRNRAATRLDDELTFHLDRQVAENIAAGMTPDEARYSALRTFGNPALLREQSRATWSWNWLESLLRDLRYIVRTLAHSPGFAAVAIFIIALGIGANVALFSLVYRIILNPLPYRDPGQLVTIYEHESSGSNPHGYLPVAMGTFFEWKQASQGAAEMAVISPFQDYNVSAEGGRLPEKIDAGMCSWNFFSVLGVAPSIGRSFGPSDDRQNSEATVILSAAFWHRRYNGDPAIVGKKIWLDAKPYAVIGVLPPSFVYSGAFGGSTVQVWTPIAHEMPPMVMETFEDHEALAIARLQPGTTLPVLISRLDAVQKRIKSEHPGPAVHDSVIGRTLLDDAVHDYKTPLYVLLAATGCVLFIASINVASLLVARIAARRKELAIRIALGGGWLRLMRERILESLLLSVFGGTLGLLLAAGALQWLVHTRPDMNRSEDIRIGGAELCFTLIAILATALFAGLISAFSSSTMNVLGSLHETSRAHSGGRARAGLRKALLVIEVSLTVVLLVGAGLLIKSYQRLRSTDLGVPIDNVLTMHVSLPGVRYAEPVQQVQFFESLITRVRALPGLQSAGLVSAAPGQGWGGDNLVTVIGHPPLPKGKGLDLQMRGADPGYFEAIQIPLVRGRLFTADERLKRANVAVISQGAAGLCFPGEDPIGRHLKIDFDGHVAEIVGVVGDTRWEVSQPPMPTLYWPIYGNYSNATIVVRSASNVATLAMPVQKIISSLDPDLPVSNVRTLRETISKSTVDSQFDSLLILAFAIVALVLAAAGLYGVLTYLVTQRTSEFGIRIALGARREQLLSTVLFDGLRPALLGLLIGLSGGAFAARLIKSMLYQTEPLDPVVFAAVTAVLLAVASIACLVPAWRASRLDPMQALRIE